MNRARLIVGSTNYDSNEDASNGVVLNLDPSEPNNVLRTNTTFQSPIFTLAVRLVGAETSLKTKVDAILADLRDLAGKTVQYQEPVGTTGWDFDPAEWDTVDPETIAEYSDNSGTAFIVFQFTASNNEVGGGGAPDVPGAEEEIVWMYELTGNGLAGMVASGLFDTLANAITYYAALIGGTRPSWVPAALRDVGATFEPVESSSGFGPVRLTVTFKEVPASVTLPAGVAEATYGVTVVDHELDIRSGIDPGREFLIAGQITVRTEGNSTFYNDTRKVAAANIVSTAQTAVDSIIAHIKACYPGADLRAMEDATLEINDLTQGIVSFRQLFISGTITRWEEQVTIVNEEPTEFTRDSKGRDYAFEPAGGPIVTVTHVLLIESIGSPQPYRRPTGLIGNTNWYRLRKELDTVTGARRTGTGEIRYTTRGGGIWRWLNTQPTSRTSESTQAERGSVQDNSIGNGRI